jgi:hypothetical protein
MVYSIDTPWASYAIPTLTNKYFRPSDNPVRVRVDDQFSQFNYMVSKVNAIKYLITRDQCDLRQAGNYLLCDVKAAYARSLNGISYPAWPQLPEGTYTAETTTYTKANNRVDNLLSQPFVIDSTRPNLTNFQATLSAGEYTNSIGVRADASDNIAIKNVRFYITSPRISDGKCDGNGIPDRLALGTLSSGSTYEATVNTAGLTGIYCINALAVDEAMNTSSPILRIQVSL